MQFVPLPAFVAMQQALKQQQQQQQQQQQTEPEQSGKDLGQTDGLPPLLSAEVKGHRGQTSCGTYVGYEMMKVLESKGEQEERTTPKCYSRCSHFSREHEASPDLSVSEHSWCRSFLKPSENVKEGTLVEDERLKRQRGKECRQTWRGGGIVQLDGATGGGGKGGGFGGRESSSSESEGDDSSEASGVPH